MIDEEQMALLIYTHVVQLSLIDVDVDEAFRLAHRVAALAFDPTFTHEGLKAARRAGRKDDERDNRD